MITGKQVLAISLALMLALVGCIVLFMPRGGQSPSSPDAEPGEDYSESWRERPIPISFDLRSVDTDGDGKGDRCYVPPIRQQNPFGSCWGFAATAAAEISILGSIEKKNPDAYKTIDLSEKQMIWFSHTPIDDPDNPQNGEGIIPNDINDAQSVYGTGGATFIAAATYAQGIGPSNEDDPKYGELFHYYGKEMNTFQRYIEGEYRNYCYSDQDDWTIPEDYRFYRDYYLTESFLLPNPSGRVGLSPYEYHPEYNEYIKEQILDKRGVCIGFCADVSRPDQDLNEIGVYLNNITWAHYTWDINAGSNHAVVIIGWDDNYPKENFLDAHQPPGDGAWLVRNSWGSGEEPFPNSGEMNWGIPVQTTDENGNTVTVGSGYFWLSYYDCSLYCPESFIFSASEIPEFVDQHDLLPVSDVIVKKSSVPVKMANVFTPNHGELLTGISCMTSTMNTEVSYEIYLLCNDFVTPDEGLLVASGSKVFEFGGYHKINLPEAICIQEGQSYSIILSMKGEDGSYVYNEASGSDMGSTLSMNAVINMKESFLFRNGGWEDYKQVKEAESAADPASQVPGLSPVYDNFPIKGYGARLAADLAMVFNITNDKFIMSDGHNTTKVKLYFRGNSGLEMGTPEVSWKFLNGSEKIAHFVPQKNGSQIELTADKAGTIYLAVSLDEYHSYGTGILKIVVPPVVPSSAFPLTPSIVYTGEPITTPLVVITKEGLSLKEGVDYTVEYSDNVLCGTATATVRSIASTDGPAPAPITCTFCIVPPKTDILSAEGSDHSVRLAFTDYLSIGANGYEVDYRKSGDVEWATKAVANSAELTIGGLDGNEEYDFRARAYIDTFNPYLGVEMKAYSDYSDVKVVKVGASQAGGAI